MNNFKKSFFLLSFAIGALAALMATVFLYKEGSKTETPDSPYTIEAGDDGTSKLQIHEKKKGDSVETIKPASISAKIRPKDNSAAVSGTFEIRTDNESSD